MCGPSKGEQRTAMEASNWETVGESNLFQELAAFGFNCLTVRVRLDASALLIVEFLRNVEHPGVAPIKKSAVAELPGRNRLADHPETQQEQI